MIVLACFIGAVLGGILLGWAIRPTEHHHHVEVRVIEMLAIDPPPPIDDVEHRDAEVEQFELARIRQLRKDWIIP